MKRYKEATEKCKRIFIGVDLDCLQWHVTIRREEVELFSGSIPGKWDSLKKLLDRYRGYEKEVVYEAGYFGFWLHDHLAGQRPAIGRLRRRVCCHAAEFGFRGVWQSRKDR